VEYLTKSELRKLAALCEDRRFADELVRDNAVDGASYSYTERCLANHEAEWMKSLSAKLGRIADSNARRVEITI
jgi:hypothetical protein